MDRLGFLGLPKFAGLIAVISVVIALLAYLGDVQERWNNDPPPGPTAAPPTTPPTPTATRTPSAVFELKPRKIDSRTVEVDVQPPTTPAGGRTNWFFVEIDWRDGNTDYYPREKLTGAAQTLVVDIPPDATLDAGRAGRVYALTPAQSADAEERAARQRTSREDDFFAEAPGAPISGSVTLPFG